MLKTSVRIKYAAYKLLSNIPAHLKMSKVLSSLFPAKGKNIYKYADTPYKYKGFPIFGPPLKDEEHVNKNETYFNIDKRKIVRGISPIKERQYGLNETFNNDFLDEIDRCNIDIAENYMDNLPEKDRVKDVATEQEIFKSLPLPYHAHLCSLGIPPSIVSNLAANDILYDKFGVNFKLSSLLLSIAHTQRIPAKFKDDLFSAFRATYFINDSNVMNGSGKYKTYGIFKYMNPQRIGNASAYIRAIFVKFISTFIAGTSASGIGIGITAPEMRANRDIGKEVELNDREVRILKSLGNILFPPLTLYIISNTSKNKLLNVSIVNLLNTDIKDIQLDIEANAYSMFLPSEKRASFKAAYNNGETSFSLSEYVHFYLDVDDRISKAEILKYATLIAKSLKVKKSYVEKVLSSILNSSFTLRDIHTYLSNATEYVKPVNIEEAIISQERLNQEKRILNPSTQEVMINQNLRGDEDSFGFESRNILPYLATKDMLEGYTPSEIEQDTQVERELGLYTTKDTDAIEEDVEIDNVALTDLYREVIKSIKNFNKFPSSFTDRESPERDAILKEYYRKALLVSFDLLIMKDDLHVGDNTYLKTDYDSLAESITKAMHSLNLTTEEEKSEFLSNIPLVFTTLATRGSIKLTDTLIQRYLTFVIKHHKPFKDPDQNEQLISLLNEKLTKQKTIMPDLKRIIISAMRITGVQRIDSQYSVRAYSYVKDLPLAELFRIILSAYPSLGEGVKTGKESILVKGMSEKLALSRAHNLEQHYIMLSHALQINLEEAKLIDKRILSEYVPVEKNVVTLPKELQVEQGVEKQKVNDELADLFGV